MSMQAEAKYADDLIYLSFIDDEHFTDAKDCAHLFQTVVLECLIDALWPWPSGLRTDHVIARYWFGSRDFIEVCHLAMLEPVSVYRLFEERIALCDAGRHEEAFAGLFGAVNRLTHKHNSAEGVQ